MSYSELLNTAPIVSELNMSNKADYYVERKLVKHLLIEALKFVAILT